MTTAVAKKRTYKCSICGEYGHNARSCPHRDRLGKAAPSTKTKKVTKKVTKKKGKVTKLRVVASKNSPKVKKLAPKPPKAAKTPKTKAVPKPSKVTKSPKTKVTPKPPKAAVAPKGLKKKKAKGAEARAFCPHEKIEYFEDEGGGGIFAECAVCGSRSPLKKTVASATAALKKIKVVLSLGKAPGNKGGSRANAGARKKLDGTDKMRGYVLEDRHVEVVMKFTDLCKAAGTAKKMSSAMRHLLERLSEKDLKRLAKAAKVEA